MVWFGHKAPKPNHRNIFERALVPAIKTRNRVYLIYLNLRNQTMIKYAPFFVILILVLIAIPLCSDAITTVQTLETERLQNRAERLEKEVAIIDLASKLEQSTTDLEKAKNDLLAAQVDLKSQGDRNAAIQKELNQTQQSLDATTARLKAAESDRDIYLDRSQAAAAQVEVYKKAFVCQNVNLPLFDYTSNQAISDGLRIFLGSLQTPIKKGEWQAIWDNSNITIHNIIGNYKWVFIVTFNDPSLGLRPSIYWVDRGCFLDWTS
jgi:hypothetical protein